MLPLRFQLVTLCLVLCFAHTGADQRSNPGLADLGGEDSRFGLSGIPGVPMPWCWHPSASNSPRVAGLNSPALASGILHGALLGSGFASGLGSSLGGLSSLGELHGSLAPLLVSRLAGDHSQGAESPSKRMDALAGERRRGQGVYTRFRRTAAWWQPCDAVKLALQARRMKAQRMTANGFRTLCLLAWS